MDEKIPDFEMPEIPKEETITKPEVKEFAEKQQLSNEQLFDFAKTVKGLNQGLKGPLPEGFKRIKMGKLVVPVSFITHVNRLSEMMDIAPNTFYQMLLMDAMNNYIAKMQAVVLQASKHPETVALDSPENVVEQKLQKEIDLLNELVRTGEYCEELSPAENLKKIYGEQVVGEA